MSLLSQLLTFIKDINDCVDKDAHKDGHFDT